MKPTPRNAYSSCCLSCGGIFILAFVVWCLFQRQEVGVESTSPDGRFTVRVTTTPELQAYLGGGAKPINYYLTDNHKGVTNLVHTARNYIDFEHWYIPGAIQWSRSSLYFLVFSIYEEGQYRPDMGSFSIIPEQVTAHNIGLSDWEQTIKAERQGTLPKSKSSTPLRPP